MAVSQNGLRMPQKGELTAFGGGKKGLCHGKMGLKDRDCGLQEWEGQKNCPRGRGLSMHLQMSGLDISVQRANCIRFATHRHECGLVAHKSFRTDRSKWAVRLVFISNAKLKVNLLDRIKVRAFNNEKFWTFYLEGKEPMSLCLFVKKLNIASFHI